MRISQEHLGKLSKCKRVKLRIYFGQINLHKVHFHKLLVKSTSFSPLFSHFLHLKRKSKIFLGNVAWIEDVDK